MNPRLTPLALLIALFVAIISQSACRAGQFVQVTVEITCEWWDDALRGDSSQGGEPMPASAPLSRVYTRPCIIGSNTWSITSPADGWINQLWFTGSNLISRTTFTREGSGNNQIGDKSTKVFPSDDGNLGRPGGVADIWDFDLTSRIAWFALCSTRCLKNPNAKLYPPDSYWKESAIFYYGWTNRVRAFDDDLGLPKSISLISTNNQTIFTYQVHQSTNVLDWNLPLEFYGMQYTGSISNGWRVDYSFRGRLTNIQPVSDLPIPNIAKR